MLSCVSLGVLLAAVTPPRWLAGGIVAMAVADTTLVVSDLLQRPNNALNAARPAAGLPQLQSATFGTAVMGYGDLFVAALLGALLAVAAGRRWQLRGATLAALLAVAFDLLFFFVDELPATVADRARAHRRCRACVERAGEGPAGGRGRAASAWSPIELLRRPWARASPARPPPTRGSTAGPRSKLLPPLALLRGRSRRAPGRAPRRVPSPAVR